MSRDFDGVDDVAEVAGQTLGLTISASIWFDADSQGEGNQGLLWSQADPARFGLRWDGVGGSKKLRFQAEWSTTGFWDMTSGFATLAGWKWVGVVYNAASSANNPVLYVFNGTTVSTLSVGSGLTKTQAPAGSFAADNKTVYLGNNAGGSRTFDGRLAEFVLWPFGRSEGSMLAQMLRGPDWNPGLHAYYKLDRGSGAPGFDYSGNGRHLTVTGAVAADDPPIPFRSGHLLSA